MRRRAGRHQRRPFVGRKPGRVREQVAKRRARRARPARRGRPSPPRARRGARAPVSSFVTDAQRSSTSRGPCTPISPSARVTPAAAVRAPHSSMIRNASTAGDTRSVDRRVISSGSSLEERYGYSRAVVVGDRVLVAGTAPIMPGDADPPAEPYEQMRRCLEIVGERAHRSRRHAGRRRAHARLPDRRRARARGDARARRGVRLGAARVHRRSSCALLDERWLCELEVEAVRR